MNKFDKIFNSENTSEASLSSEESLAAVALVAALANSPDTDADILESILWESEIFAEYSEDDMSAMLEKLAGIATKEGLGALFNTAGNSMPDEFVLDTFAITVAMFVVDGEVSDKHQHFLKEFQQALGLEDEEADEVIEEVITAYSEEDGDYFEEDGDYSEEDGELYKSPKGYFTVPIPVDPQRGGRIEDEQEGCVNFSDDFGILLKINYVPIAGEVAELVESVGELAYLSSFVNNYIDGAILAKLPNSKLLHTESLEDEEAYFAVVDIPGGATITVQTDSVPVTRLNAYRGILAFIAEDVCYTVSSQKVYREPDELGSLESEVEAMMDKILEFIETIEFGAPE
ncbi:tellurite resistance TerB family protein [Tychonema sp. BBK16]|uniref:tellurite resistance TerB family protein n=1 Tax=Tychonema sp. BBK16 TaxID=2699888 RepID=UPI001F203026|nr:tellurite resistance TerB family protein [Tychonema sp. BBK16]MCF6373208.1 tellurite resistance TerB family protein [Tychonema sp. BBK16]